MQRFVVLFRGINVGGKNILPMKVLVELLENNHFEQVAYYIQSGNVLVTCESNPEQTIKAVVAEHFGFTPEVFVLNEKELLSASANNPYQKYEGKTVHLYFCHGAITLNKDKFDKYIAPSEQVAVKGNVFYLHAPDGVGRSKLVANIETCLGQTGTGRNLNTVNKLIAMLKNS